MLYTFKWVTIKKWLWNIHGQRFRKNKPAPFNGHIKLRNYVILYILIFVLDGRLQILCRVTKRSKYDSSFVFSEWRIGNQYLGKLFAYRLFYGENVLNWTLHIYSQYEKNNWWYASKW